MSNTTRRLHGTEPPRNGHNGFTLASTSVVLGIIMVFGMILVASVLYSNRTGRMYTSAISAVQIAEAGVNKAMYCLKAASGGNCSGTYGGSHLGETDVPFGGGKFTTTVSGGGSGRSVTSTGTDITGRTQTVRVDLTNIPPNDDPEFTHALQAGQDGIYMENGAEVTGSVYSGGDVICKSTQAEVDGDVYVSKTGGLIQDCTVNYHAHADQILGCEVGGDVYYDQDPSGIDGTDYDGAAYANSSTPTPKDMPAPDLDFWRASASAGGTISGTYEPADGESLGPKKIIGDLKLNQNVDLIVTGPLWVTGDLITENNATMTLHSSFGAYGTVVLADHQSDQSAHGRIDMVPTSQIFGTGDPKSHILLISTNTSLDKDYPAIKVANNAASAIFLATNGVLRLLNNANAKSMAARKLYLDANAVVTYEESEVADMKFSNSPANSWFIVPGTWRQTN